MSAAAIVIGVSGIQLPGPGRKFRMQLQMELINSALVMANRKINAFFCQIARTAYRYQKKQTIVQQIKTALIA